MKLAVALAAVIALTIGIVMLPSKPVGDRIGDSPVLVSVACPPDTGPDKDGWMTTPACPQRQDERPYKSGLRMAVEGRLRWLGL